MQVQQQQHQWGLLESTQGRAFFYNPNHGGFEWGGGEGEYIGDEAIYKQIEEATKGLCEAFVENRPRGFEIRPVFAVER